MFRLLPILALALLPAAVAAPVPPQAEAPPFGPDGLLSEADLEKVVFDSRPVPKDEVERVKRLEQLRAERIEPKPKRPRGANEFDVAVHIPHAVFRQGGPAPAYFVLRNNRGHELELHSRLDLVGPEPLLRGDGRLYDIRDRKIGRSVVQALAATHCGGGHLVEVPPDGFFCQKVDLNRLAGGPLPAGEYEVEWRSGPWRARPTPFTVLAREGDAKPPPARPMLRFLHLTEDFGDEDRVQKAIADETPRLVAWDRTELETVEANDLAAALAVGQTGVYVPDLYHIPARDKLVSAEAVFRPYRDGDRIAVTLGAVAPLTRIEFDDPPQLYLQLETPMPLGATAEEARRQKKARAIADVPVLTTPLTIEARLPAGWRELVGASGPAKLSVLVVSKELDIPKSGLQKAKEVRARQERGDDDPPCWAGVVRTTATAVHLPEPLEVQRR